MSAKCNYSYILTIWKEAAALAEPIHDGHRKRMRERYLRAGIIAFDPHDRIQNVEEIEKIIRHNAKK